MSATASIGGQDCEFQDTFISAALVNQPRISLEPTTTILIGYLPYDWETFAFIEPSLASGKHLEQVRFAEKFAAFYLILTAVLTLLVYLFLAPESHWWPALALLCAVSGWLMLKKSQA